MGWISYHATYYKNGRIDRKAECDGYFLEGLNAGWNRVLKSTMFGSVYYAAVEPLKRYGKKQADGMRPVEDIPEAERRVIGVVLLTSTNANDYHNFFYKVMDESMGPVESECPESILKLLSPTDSEWANEWRGRCRENAKRKKSPDTLNNLPVGAVIRFKTHDGTVRQLLKHQPAYQFKRPFWYDETNHTYTSVKHIPSDYEIVSR